MPNVDQANQDGDAWGDTCDNCPAVSTPWLVPPGDSDCDGFTDTVEAFVGTNPSLKCAATTTQNDETDNSAVPADINDDQVVNGSDVGKMNAAFFHFGPDLPYKKRLDLNTDNLINGADVLKMSAMFLKFCSP